MEYAFTIDTNIDPPSCLPAYLSKEGLIDVTLVWHTFRVYLDPKTGITHNGAAYYEEAKQYGRAT
jgi:hypothetical protein